jgi:signal transduction histidine kinase
MSSFIQSSIQKKHLYFLNQLKEKSEEARNIAQILSQTPSVSEALTGSKYFFLNQEALDFSKIEDGEIYFTDIEHKIIASSKKLQDKDSRLEFNNSCSSGQLVRIYGELKIAFCQKLLTSKDKAQGYVLSMVALDNHFLEKISKEYLLETDFSYKGIYQSSFNNKNVIANFNRTILPYRIGNDTIDFTLYTNNKDAQASLLQGFVTLFVVTLLLGLLLIILIPFTFKKFITSPLQLLEKKISQFYHNEILNDLHKMPASEIKDFYIALHKLQTTIKEKTETLEKDNHLLRVLSHDVSNTLTVIQARLMRFKRSEDLPLQERNEQIDKLLASIKLANGVLAHVKELKAIESGKIELKLEPTSIQEVFELAHVIFDDRLMEKEIVLTLQDSSNGELFLCHKNSFTNSVFNNLISNAIKFSPHGSEIMIKASSDNDTYQISIIDQGIGIPEEIAINLFNIGKATSRSGTDGESGTGFGMSIVKTYMEQYGGKLNFRSQTDGKTGTIFELLLQKVI